MESATRLRRPATCRIEVGFDGNVRSMDKAALRLWRRQRAPASAHELWPEAEPGTLVPGTDPLWALTGDGALIPVRVEVTGHSDHISLAIQDATATHQELERIRTSEAQLREAQEVAGVGSWEWDIRQNQITWSDRLFHTFGLDPATFEATYEAYMEHIHPEDRELVQSTVEQAMQDHQPWSFQHRILRADGTIRWVHGQGAVEVEGGQPVRMYGTEQDITGEKEADDRFQRLMDATPDPIVLVDADGIIRYANRRVEDLTGAPAASFLDQPVSTLLPDIDESSFLQARSIDEAPRTDDDHAASRNDATTYEVSVKHKDGQATPAEVRVRQVQWASQQMVMAAIRDVTDRRKAEEADRVAFERLLEIEHLKETAKVRNSIFNATSHELKTPLTPLRLQLHMLDSGKLGPLNPDQQRCVDMLNRNVERLSDLIMDVLDIARLESGSLKLLPSETDATGLVTDVFNMFDPAADQAGIAWSMKAPPELHLIADRDRLMQVLINLVSNALKFTAEGGHVTLSAHDLGGTIRFEVQDDGAGIDAVDQARLFLPFSQVHDPTEYTERGTGLGLSICKGLVKEHGGEIGVDSKGKGFGSTFWFTIPTDKLTPAT